jgi:predicted transcriptional regulator of viral defense system
MNTTYKTALWRSSEFLAELHAKGKVCFTHDEALKILNNKSKNTVSKMLHDMSKRGLLMRLKTGVYYIIPYEQEAATFMPDWHLIAQYLVGEAKYYIGYYSAMQVQSLITQPALKEQIVVDRQILPASIKIKNTQFQFIYHNEKHFFGSKKMWIDSFNKVDCSDLEKTIVDALFKPEYAGGISQIAKSIHKKKSELDLDKLGQYVHRFDSLSVAKRLGYLLELLEVQNPLVETLQLIKTSSYFTLEPSYPKTGKRLKRWSIIENIEPSSILAPIYS